MRGIKKGPRGPHPSSIRNSAGAQVTEKGIVRGSLKTMTNRTSHSIVAHRAKLRCAVALAALGRRSILVAVLEGMSCPRCRIRVASASKPYNGRRLTLYDALPKQRSANARPAQRSDSPIARRLRLLAFVPRDARVSLVRSAGAHDRIAALSWAFIANVACGRRFLEPNFRVSLCETASRCDRLSFRSRTARRQIQLIDCSGVELTLRNRRA